MQFALKYMEKGHYFELVLQFTISYFDLRLHILGLTIFEC